MDPRWSGPCKPWEDPKVYRLVRFVMTMDIAHVKFQYAMNHLGELILVRFQSEMFANFPQRCEEKDDITSETCIRGFIKMVEEISEPLVTQNLDLAEHVGYTDSIKTIRNDQRNNTTHRIREPHDLDIPYNISKTSLTRELHYVFDNLYPTIRKSLCRKIKKGSHGNMTYEVLLGKMKEDQTKYEKDDDDITSFISFRSTDATTGLRKGVIRPSTKFSEGSPFYLLSDLQEKNPLQAYCCLC